MPKSGSVISWLRVACSVISMVATSAHAEVVSQSPEQGVDALFADFDQPGSAGAAVAIYHNGRTVYSHGYGYADLEQGTPITPQTRFHVASVSKQFTSFAIALLARDGKVDLDADIHKYLPYVPDFGAKISVRHLLNHSSGLREQWMLYELTHGGNYDAGGLTQAQAINLVTQQRELNFTPGSRYQYCNTNTMLLAEIVRAVSGQTLREFTTERMFKPLGMNNTFFFDDVEEVVPGRAYSYSKRDGRWRKQILNLAVVGPTGLLTSVEDLALWAKNFAHPSVGDAALIAQISAPSKLKDGTSIDYGFGLMRPKFAGYDTIAHEGGDAGYHAYLAYFPSQDFAIAITGNTGVEMDRVITAIAKLYLKPAPVDTDALPESKRIATDPALGAALAGTYFPDEGVSFNLVWRAGVLWRTGTRTAQIEFRSDGSLLELRSGAGRGLRFKPVEQRPGKVLAIEMAASTPETRGKIYRRLDPVAWSRTDLSAFTGEYRSPELDVTYLVEASDQALRVRSLWRPQATVFKPIGTDRFEAVPGGQLLAERDARGQVTALRWTLRGVNNLFLHRVGSPH